jgi:hypothetical protein
VLCFAEDSMLFSGSLLNLALHVPVSCSTTPNAAQQSVLRAAGMSSIITETSMEAACLPVIHSPSADELVVDEMRWMWLRGDRASLLDRAAGMGGAPFIASCPKGGASSESALKRSCILAWQLKATHRCSAFVLPWPELEAAADAAGSDGWHRIAAQLTRMQNPTWTMVHGG